MMLAITVAAVIVLAAIRCAIFSGVRRLLLDRFRCRRGVMAITHRHALVRSHGLLVVCLALHDSTRHGISRSIEDQANAQQQAEQEVRQGHRWRWLWRPVVFQCDVCRITQLPTTTADGRGMPVQQGSIVDM